MHLGGVCRSWRYTVLATPRALSFINLKDKRALPLLLHFLQQSGQRPYYVSLEKEASDKHHAAAMQVADRFQCLTIPNFMSHLIQAVFPALTKLFLYHQAQ
jgi:hypothetical protein